MSVTTPPNLFNALTLHNIRTALAVAFGVLLVVPSVLAQTAALKAIRQSEANMPAEAKPYVVVAPGVVKDTRTGLDWMRCSLGQDWSNKAQTCNGKVEEFTWEDAVAIATKLNAVGGYANRTDWRLPTIRELQSIRYCSKGFEGSKDLEDGKGSVPELCMDGSTDPAIAQTIFPATLRDFYWSATPYAGYSSSAWGVSFDNGLIGYDHRVFRNAVRLVR